ncbi:MAG: FAD-dependent oxidoreductase [Usitatibacter sp.]
MKIAIIGAGIAGNVVARQLYRHHDITVYEAGDHVGGHSHTHVVEQEGRRYDVDTGFIVFNDRNYPLFGKLLAKLGVATRQSSMSFSVRAEASGLEYNGTDLNGLFAQRRNLLRPSFLGMLRDIARFNRVAPRLLEVRGGELPLGEFLSQGRYGRAFVDYYLIPMGAAIWSTDPASMLEFPARFFVRFLHNHGMLRIENRPVWRTVAGGSARYVEKLVAPFRHRIRLRAPVESIRRVTGGAFVKARGCEAVRYDAAFLACHSDQALALLADPTPAERAVLGAIPYRRNEAVLHTDERLLPRSRRAWASWNYHVLAEPGTPVALTYNMNMLQGLDAPRAFLVTLNRGAAIDPERVIKRMSYDHPLFTPAAVAAQARHAELNRGATFYCGAYWRNGFHEDGVASAHEALRHFRERASAGARVAA